jgi:dipeptidyl-peptidase 4
VKHRLSVARFVPLAILLGAIGLLQVSTAAQDRLKTMPGYPQYQKMSLLIPGAVKLGSLGVTWNPDGRSFEYSNDGKRFRFDVTTLTAIDIGVADTPAGRAGRGGGGRGAGSVPERGRQFESALSPDGKLKAF